MNFPLSIAFVASHRFWGNLSPLSFSFSYFFISFLISLLTNGLFSSMFFSLHVVSFVSFLFLWLISSFMPLWSEKVLEIISILLNLLRLALCPKMWSILENVPCALKKNVYSVVLDVMSSKCPLSLTFLVFPLWSLLPYWFLHWHIGFFSSMLFSLHVVSFFSFLFLWVISSFMPLWSEKILEIISKLLYLLRLVLCPSMWLILENVSCALEKMYIPFSWT